MSGKTAARATGAEQIGGGPTIFPRRLLLPRAQFQGAAGQVGIGQCGLHRVARLKSKRSPAVHKERAAAKAGGQRTWRLARTGHPGVVRPIVRSIDPRTEQYPTVVDPDRARNLCKLAIFVTDGIEGQLASRLEPPAVESAE